MAHLIGGTPAFPGKNNILTGADDNDVIFGDPFTTGNTFGLEEIGGALSNGKGGKDELNGLGGDDSLVGDAYQITNNGQGGDDKIDGGEGIDQIFGDAINLLDSSRGGNDWLIAGNNGSFNYLAGDASFMHGTARGGDDHLEGGNVSDELYGDAFTMASSSRGGNDQIEGGASTDIIFGDARTGRESASGGDDQIEGGTGDDHLYGDFQELSGGWTGQGGNDVFVFAPGSGVDQIGDFEQGKDKLDVSGYGITAIGQMTITSDGSNSFIDLDGLAVDNTGNEILAFGVATFVTNDFIFT